MVRNGTQYGICEEKRNVFRYLAVGHIKIIGYKPEVYNMYVPG